MLIALHIRTDQSINPYFRAFVYHQHDGLPSSSTFSVTNHRPLYVRSGDRWNSSAFQWTEQTYSNRRLGYSTSYLFSFGVYTDYKNSSKRIIDIDDPALGMGRKYLIKGRVTREGVATSLYEVIGWVLAWRRQWEVSTKPSFGGGNSPTVTWAFLGEEVFYSCPSCFQEKLEHNFWRILQWSPPLSAGFDDKFVQAYYKYMVDMALALGADEESAKQEMKESLLFEIKLANVSAEGWYLPRCIHKDTHIAWLMYVLLEFIYEEGLCQEEIEIV